MLAGAFSARTAAWRRVNIRSGLESARPRWPWSWASSRASGGPRDELAAQLLQLPSSQQKQEAEADERGRAAQFVHHTGEIEHDDGEGKAGHAQVNALAALLL